MSKNTNKSHCPGDGSTGPKSSAGKERCSRNATTHGARSETHVILPTEDPAEYEKLRRDWYDEFPPLADLDIEFLDRLAQRHWHSKRCERLHDEAFLRALTNDPDPMNWPDEIKKHIALMERYRTTADRAWRAAHKDIVNLRKRRLDDLLLKEKLRRAHYQNYRDGLIQEKPNVEQEPTVRSEDADQPDQPLTPARRLS